MASNNVVGSKAEQGSYKSESPAAFYQRLVGVLAPSKPSGASTASSRITAQKQATRVFRKGGVITSLDEYTAVPSSTSTAAQTAFHPPSGPPARLGPQIGSSNVGYRLLKQAGWQEGQGLGSSQQGRSIPLAAYHQQARQGIGVHGPSGDEAKHRQPNRQGGTAPIAPQARAADKKRPLPVPDVPEALEVKRKRHQQMIQAEAEEQERRAIQRHMYRAFNDFSGEATSDSNPLARPNKLTRTNPLL